MDKAHLSLKPGWNLPQINAISTIRALVQHGQPLIVENHAIERAVDHGETTVDV